MTIAAVKSFIAAAHEASFETENFCSEALKDLLAEIFPLGSRFDANVKICFE